MKNKETLRGLLVEAADLHSDYGYLSFKVPEILNKLQNITHLPKELEDEYETALREMEYIDNNLG